MQKQTVKRGDLKQKQKQPHCEYPYMRLRDYVHSTKGQVVLTEAIYIANQANSLLTIFLKFFSTHLKKDSPDFNVLFVFWVSLFIFREKLNPNCERQTEASQLYQFAIMSHMEKIQMDRDAVEKAIQILVQNVISEWKQLRIGNSHIGQLQYTIKKRQIDAYFKDQIRKICDNPKKVQFLVPSQFKNTQESMKNYLKANLQALYRVEWLKETQRNLRLENFLFETKNYFKTFKIEQYQRCRTFSYGSQLQCIQDGPQKISLQDLINLRMKGQNYYQQSKMLIQELYHLVRNYHMAVTDRKGGYLHYKHLHPRFILFDQFSLKLKLTQYPIFIEALGLIDEPMSIETRLVFQSTPRVPAVKCLTPPQIQQKQLYCDSFYGEQWWHTKQAQSNDQKWQNERKMREQMEEENIFWKFLHVAYFIINGEYFNQNIHIQDDYEQSILQAKRQLQDNPQRIRKLLSLKCLTIPISLSFTLEELSSILQLQKEQDQIISSMAKAKLDHQLTFYSLTRKKVVNLLKENPFFFNYSNIKAYILIVQLEIVSSLYYTVFAYSAEDRRTGASEQVRKVSQAIAITIENASTAINTFHTKSNDYLNREGNNTQRMYLESIQGRQIMDKTNSIISRYQTLMRNQQQLDILITKHGFTNCKQIIAEFTQQAKKLYVDAVLLSKLCFSKLVVSYIERGEQNTQKKHKNEFSFRRCHLLARNLWLYQPKNCIKYENFFLSSLIFDDYDFQSQKDFQVAKNVLNELDAIFKQEEKDIKSMIFMQ